MYTEITAITPSEHMRRRPAMYIGSTDKKGFAYMLENVLVDFTDLYKTDNFLCSIVFHKQYMKLELTGSLSTILTEKTLGPMSNSYGYLYITALAYLSSRFEASLGHTTLVFVNGMLADEPPVFRHNHTATISFVFKPDDTIFKTPVQDFEWLSQTLRQFAMLNRNMQLLIKDIRRPYHSQSYFYYPDGIVQLFEKNISEKHSGNLFKLQVEQTTGSYTYQLCIGFNRALWKNETLSFANHIHTYCGGSLEDGVLQGIIKALKQYVSRFTGRRYSFTRSSVKQGLTQVLAVRGTNLEYAGCTKAELAVPLIKTEARNLVYNAVLTHLNQHPQHAADYIAMFDKTAYHQTERRLTHCTMQCIVAQPNVAVAGEGSTH